MSNDGDLGAGDRLARGVDQTRFECEEGIGREEGEDQREAERAPAEAICFDSIALRMWRAMRLM